MSSASEQRQFQWAVAGRPRPGESVSGDEAFVVYRDERTLLAAIDGLGHGPEAAEAAGCARAVIEANAAESLPRMIALCHAAMIGTRGAALTLAAVDHATATMEWLAVGNVEATRSRGEPPQVQVDMVFHYSGVVGYLLPEVQVRTTVMEPGDLLVFATDGIGSAFLDDLDPQVPPDVLARRIVERHARLIDDAVVLAACYPRSA